MKSTLHVRRELTPPAEMPALLAITASQRLLIKTAQLLARIARTQNNGGSIRCRMLVERLQKISFGRAQVDSPNYRWRWPRGSLPGGFTKRTALYFPAIPWPK